MGAVPLFGADTMLFIYLFESNPAFESAAVRIFAAAESGQCRLVVSTLALLEILVVPKRNGNESLCQEYRRFFESFPHLQVNPVDREIAEIASDIRAESKIRTPDAVHLATAIQAGAAAFLSEDSRLSQPRIPVLGLEKGLEVLGT